MTWIVTSPLDAAEYSLFPDKMTGERANSKVLCKTPTGWEGWKDDPHYWDGVSAFDRRLLQGAQRVGVLFVQPGCRVGLNCPKLDLHTIGLDALSQPNTGAALRYLVEGLKHQRCGDREPDVVRAGSFEGGDAGALTIWKIHCESHDDHFATFILRRDVLITIQLSAPDIKYIVDKLDSLKELARSVHVVKR